MLSRGTFPLRQQGAILAITAILLVVLIGIAALALDIGRVLVLRTEMQNAADSAALAAARELDGQSGAVARAMAAARDLLIHEGHHAKAAELLGGSMASGATPFRFFCAIGSQYDEGNTCTGTAIDDGSVDDGKIPATSDEDAHYVRVTLQPHDDTDAYRVALFFLPVLSSDHTQDVYASAVAGRHFSICNYPPVMICDPFEDDAANVGVDNFRDAVDANIIEPGDMMVLKYQGPDAAWAPGNFAFLSPGVPGDYQTGARAVGEYLANPCQQPCTPPIVKTKPGSVESWPVWGLNTYFEVYGQGSFSPGEYPPAPNIIEYPGDTGYKSWDTGNRFGNGNWDWQDYRDLYHKRVVGGTVEYDPGFANLSGMTRWEVYNREIGEEGDGNPHGYLPLNPDPDGPDGLNSADTGKAKDDLDNMDPAKVALADAEEPLCTESECVCPTAGSCSPSSPGHPSYTDPWTCSSKGRKVPGVADCEDVEPAGSSSYPTNFFPDGRPDANDMYFDGTTPKECEAIRQGETPSTPNSLPERRKLFVAVIQCNSQIVHGSTNPVVRTFAEFFVLQRARIDKIDNRKIDVTTEFMGLVDEKESNYHVEVQLYE
jgi:hypothetical protein